ncbi:MAG: ABC transporter permease, partial [Planctomycetota bacterium]
MGTLRRILLAEGFQSATIPIVAVTLSLAVCWCVIALTTPAQAPIGRWKRANEAYKQLAEGSLGVKFDPKTGDRLPLAPLPKNRALGETALKTALLVLTGLSVAIALRAGLFNIGAEGQFIVGAITAAWFGWWLDLPPAIHPVVVMLLAMTAAGLYGALAGALKVWRGVHEVIGTIMLNWIAYYLVTQWLVIGPLNVTTLMGESGATSVNEAGTPEVRASALLWPLFERPNRMNAGILIALWMAFLAWLFLYRTRLGYEIRAIGSGPEAARAA